MLQEIRHRIWVLVEGEHLPLPSVEPQYATPEGATQPEHQNEDQSECKKVTAFPVQAMDDDTFQSDNFTQLLQNASGGLH